MIIIMIKVMSCKDSNNDDNSNCDNNNNTTIMTPRKKYTTPKNINKSYFVATNAWLQRDKIIILSYLYYLYLQTLKIRKCVEMND